jgi:hypothetical protein
MDHYGFAVFGIAPDEVVEASAISDLLVKHGDDLFEQCGGRNIFQHDAAMANEKCDEQAARGRRRLQRRRRPPHSV